MTKPRQVARIFDAKTDKSYKNTMIEVRTKRNAADTRSAASEMYYDVLEVSVESTRDNVVLLLLCELDEVYRIA